jgi:hypothetical protein
LRYDAHVRKRRQRVCHGRTSTVCGTWVCAALDRAHTGRRPAARAGQTRRARQAGPRVYRGGESGVTPWWPAGRRGCP